MAKNERNMDNKRKKLIIKIAIITTVFLIVCTFVSRSVYVMLLPNVETIEAQSTSINNTIELVGSVNYTDNIDIYSPGAVTITNVHANPGRILKEGEELYSINVGELAIEEKRLKLALSQLESQLTPESISDAKKKETQLMLNIAQMEYDLFKINNELESALEDKKYSAKVQKLKEQSDETKASLDIAELSLNDYQLTNAGMDRTSEIKLRKLVAQLERKLKSNTLTDAERDDLEMQLYNAKYELESIVSEYPEYDPSTEQRLRLEVLRASNNLLLMDEEGIPTDEITAAQIDYEIAQDEYSRYLQTQSLNNRISEDQLQLQILKLKNELDANSLSQAEKNQLNLSIEIARDELNLFKSRYPSDGIIRAEQPCKVTKVYIEKDSQIAPNELVVSVAPLESTYIIEWEASYVAGLSFPQNSETIATYNAEKIGVGGKTILEKKSAKLNVTSKKLDNEKKVWVYTGKFKEDPQEQLSDGLEMIINMSVSSDFYNAVVPISCLTSSADGSSSVMVVQKRNGLFSEEIYVSEVKVTVKEQNNLYAAVDGASLYSGVEVVKYRSKPLRNNSVVNVLS